MSEGLKPDMSAEVTIQVDPPKEPVLCVPLQAVVGGAEGGGKRKVFVMTPAGPQEREVTLGLFNEKMVEVKEGLAEGDEVVLNPKVLLGDKAKTREARGRRPAGAGPRRRRAGAGGEKAGGKGGGAGGGTKGGRPAGRAAPEGRAAAAERRQGRPAATRPGGPGERTAAARCLLGAGSTRAAHGQRPWLPFPHHQYRSPPMPAIVQVIDLIKNYYMGDVTVNVLRALNLAFDEGDFVALMGPSGSGKSTLMNILGCLDRPTAGQYILRDQNVADMSDDELSEVR